MNVRVDLSTPIYDGMEVVFKAPCDASQVTGLNLYYQQEMQNFSFADANANDVGDLDALFAEGAVVKVILDTYTNMAFIQNGDTNAYLENRFKEIGTGGGTSGSNQLVVTITRDADGNRISSHGSLSIFNHIKSGGSAVAYIHEENGQGEYHSFDWVDTAQAVIYTHNLMASSLGVLSIVGSDVVSVYSEHASAKSVQDLKTDMGDIETALDSILEIQNELIGGDGV